MTTRARANMKPTDPTRVHVAGPKPPAAAPCPHCGKSASDPVAVAPPAPAAEPPPVLRYMVVKGGTFSMGGNMCAVTAGQIVTLHAYGRDGIKRMTDRGIVLQPAD